MLFASLFCCPEREVEPGFPVVVNGTANATIAALAWKSRLQYSGLTPVNRGILALFDSEDGEQASDDRQGAHEE